MLALINENQLDQWVRANAREAQGLIVELIWRLVSASCPSPRERRFPLGDSIGQHGPDGVLDTASGFEPFVPEGRSFWEIGTDLQPRKKANTDYNTRTKAIPENIRRESTFVIVTPLSGRRDWEYTWKPEAQAQWIEAHRARQEWKDIRVIDGTKLIDWLHHFPAVEIWFAEQIIDLPKLNVETPEQHWKVIRALGSLSLLSPEIFLLNREEACEKLQEVFSGKLNIIRLMTHFPDEVIDFVAAYLASLDSERRAEITGRCLIVRGQEAWETVVSRYKGYILVADPRLDLNSEEGSRLISKAYQAGHRVIVAAPRGGNLDSSTSISLPSPHIHQLQEGLQKAGYSGEDARVLAQRSGGSLRYLLNRLQGVVMPRWAQEAAASDLALAMLVGSWNEKKEADRGIVEMITGEPYNKWITRLREIALRPGVPLTQRDGKWKFISRYEAWYALGSRIFDDHLDRVKQAAIIVLQEKDPQLDLPKEKRWQASIYGKVFSYSPLLRKGLADTLALLGSHSKPLTSCSQEKAETIVYSTVRDLLLDADWSRWASLDDVLPLLAEASPKVFLDVVEEALNNPLCPFDEIFAQESEGLFGRSYMVGLLKAFETVAWEPDHLIRAVLCLGKLADRDPGGQCANRPMSSLTTILLPWFPQTCAPAAKQVVAVKTLLTELPEVGWVLLLKLLPQSHALSLRARKPAWRESLPTDWSDGVTVGEYWKQVEKYSEIAAIAAGSDYRKLSEIVEYLNRLSPSAQEKLIELLGSDKILALPESEKTLLWNKLLDFVVRQKKFADASWSMPSDKVSKIEAIANRIAPRDPSRRYQRLFSEYDVDLFENKVDYEEQWQKLEERRRIAVKEVEASGGTQAILDFATSVEAPWKVGFAFGAIAKPEVDRKILPQLLETGEDLIEQFATGYVKGRFHNYGWQWVDGINTSIWTPAQIARFLCSLPFAQETWERTGNLLGENESLYWSYVDVNPYVVEIGIEQAIEPLINHNRPFAAIRCIVKMLNDQQPFNSDMAIRALHAVLQMPEKVSPMDAYDILQVIKALQNDPSTNPNDLLYVEWAYLPLLIDDPYGAWPKTLEQRLARDPDFFCEIIRLAFRPEKDDCPQETVMEKAKSNVYNAYRLLAKWRLLPGSRGDGTLDQAAFEAWLNAVKEKCEGTGHLDIAMQMIGQVLIHTPPDPDGLWIHHVVAKALNANDAEHMRIGFLVALLNSRGVYWVDPSGKPERELADQYRKQAEEIEMAGYHRIASTLRDLAEDYDRQVKWILSRRFPDG